MVTRSFLFANITIVGYLTSCKPLMFSLAFDQSWIHIFKSKARCSNGRYNMTENIKYNIDCNRSFALLRFFLFGMVSCRNDTSDPSQAQTQNSVIRSIDSLGQFNKILEISNERLLILDFYADWCPPCKELTPILEKIAKENSDNVAIYKIDIDRHRELSNSFRVTGIPHVAFVKNKENIFSLTGLYPKTMYLKVIQQYSKPANLNKFPHRPYIYICCIIF